MMPIFLVPVFKERIWGGTKLRQMFGYEIPSDRTGECWAISAHPHGQSVVRDGPLAGMTLGELWTNHQQLFGDATHKSAVFPLLTKILDASKDLSVQVHPDDAYALTHENGELGKTECWYILDAEPDAEIIFGHTATTREELATMITDGRWDDLLTRVTVRPGDFFYVPSGTIHALGEGIVVLETQQSSDTTYRVYDYDRVDEDGRKRALHLDQAIQVTTVPHIPMKTSSRIERSEDATFTTYGSNEFFTVQRVELKGSYIAHTSSTFRIGSVISGSGSIEHAGHMYGIEKGDHFILPAHAGSYHLCGDLELIISWPS